MAHLRERFTEMAASVQRAAAALSVRERELAAARKQYRDRADQWGRDRADQLRGMRVELRAARLEMRSARVRWRAVVEELLNGGVALPTT